MQNLKECSLEVAALMAEEVKSQDPQPKYVCVHRYYFNLNCHVGKTIFYISRKEDATGFARKYLSEVGADIVKLLTWGDEKGAGQMILEGPETLVAQLGPK